MFGLGWDGMGWDGVYARALCAGLKRGTVAVANLGRPQRDQDCKWPGFCDRSSKLKGWSVEVGVRLLTLSGSCVWRRLGRLQRSPSHDGGRGQKADVGALVVALSCSYAFLGRSKSTASAVTEETVGDTLILSFEPLFCSSCLQRPFGAVSCLKYPCISLLLMTRVTTGFLLGVATRLCVCVCESFFF